MLESSDFSKVLEFIRSPLSSQTIDPSNLAAIDSFRQLLAEHGSDEEDIRFIFAVLELEDPASKSYNDETSRFESSSSFGGIDPGSTSSASDHEAVQHEYTGAYTNPGEVEMHVAIFRNNYDRMLIIRIPQGGDLPYLEKVVSPDDEFLFTCPLNSTIEIFRWTLGGQELFKTIRSDDLSWTHESQAFNLKDHYKEIILETEDTS